MALATKIKASFLALGLFLNTAVADTGVLLTPHNDMQLHNEASDKQPITLSDALKRIDSVSPDVAAEKKRYEQWKIKATFNPEERPTPLTWTVYPAEIPAMMLLEEIRKLTFGRLEKFSLRIVNEAYALLAWDNYVLVSREAQNDLKKLYVSSVINDNYLDTLKDNSQFFESAYKDAEILEKNRAILPSDLIKIRNYKNQIERDIATRTLKKDIYNRDLSLLIDEKKFALVKEGALTTEKYNFDLNKIRSYIDNHPEARKNADMLLILRSDRIYKQLSKRSDFVGYVSITIRRVVFEGPFLFVKRPTVGTLASLFQDINAKQKKKLRKKEIETAEADVKASIVDLTVKMQNQYYIVNDKFAVFEEAQDKLELQKRNFFEKQQLYGANKIQLTDLVEAKVNLYEAELNYLSTLEDYNLSISDLQYHSGKFNND